MIAVSGWCATLAWIALHGRVAGNDAAGNGVATGFLHGYAEGRAECTALFAGVYLLCRWRPVRYACVGLLSLAMFVLVR